MSTDTQQLAELLDKILLPTTSQTLRTEFERSLTNSAKENPNAFITSLVEILKDQNYQTPTKQSACFWLKSGLSTYHAGIDDFYPIISQETRN